MIKDCLGTELQAEYPIDKITENWIVEENGKQVFFNLLFKVFGSVQPVPASVVKYSTEMFHQNDSLSNFIEEFLRPAEYESKSNNEKRALRLRLSEIYTLYTEYCSIEGLGIPQIQKKLKRKLTDNKLNVARGKHGLEVRGVLLNTEKIHMLSGIALENFRRKFTDQIGMSIEMYNQTFECSPTIRNMEQSITTEQQWSGSQFMRPISLQETMDNLNNVHIFDEEEKVHSLPSTTQ